MVRARSHVHRFLQYRKIATTDYSMNVLMTDLLMTDLLEDDARGRFNVIVEKLLGRLHRNVRAVSPRDGQSVSRSTSEWESLSTQFWYRNGQITLP